MVSVICCHATPAEARSVPSATSVPGSCARSSRPVPSTRRLWSSLCSSSPALHAAMVPCVMMWLLNIKVVCLGDVFDVLKVFDLFLEVVLFVFVFLLAAPCILYLFRWSKYIYCIKPVYPNLSVSNFWFYLVNLARAYGRVRYGPCSCATRHGSGPPIAMWSMVHSLPLKMGFLIVQQELMALKMDMLRRLLIMISPEVGS